MIKNPLVDEARRQGALVDEVTASEDRIVPGFTYPAIYGDLLRNHLFVAFNIGPVRLYGNVRTDEDNLDQLLADKALTTALVDAHFIPFGRPSSGDYDRMCFNVRRKKPRRDAVIVRMDHEAILSKGTMPKPLVIADGNVELIRLANQGPMQAARRKR